MTTTTAAPKGTDGETIQILRYRQGTAQQVTIDATAGGNRSTAFNAATRVIEIRADVDCHFEQGESAITTSTSDHFLPADETRLVATGGDQQTRYTHIAVIRAVGDGTLYVSEME